MRSGFGFHPMHKQTRLRRESPRRPGQLPLWPHENRWKHPVDVKVDVIFVDVGSCLCVAFTISVSRWKLRMRATRLPELLPDSLPSLTHITSPAGFAVGVGIGALDDKELELIP